MSPLRSEDLTRREREIVNAVFALGNRASAIRDRLIDPPSYSDVRAMLVRLERKGHIRHIAARRDALRSYVRTFFGGSLATRSLIR